MNDLISRQALLESIERISVKGNVLDDDWIYRFVQEFPSAEPEIIRCKDCKHYKIGTDGLYYCYNHDDDILWQDDDYCSRGERKEE